MGFFQEGIARLSEVQMIFQEKGKDKNRKKNPNHDQAAPCHTSDKAPANQPRRADDGPGHGLCPLCKGFYSAIHSCWKRSPITTPRPEKSTHTVLKGYPRHMARSLAGLASYTRHLHLGPGWSEASLQRVHQGEGMRPKLSLLSCQDFILHGFPWWLRW